MSGRKPSREARMVKYTVYLPEKFLVKIRKHAKNEDRYVSELLREALSIGLKRMQRVREVEEDEYV